ncbi:RtcB family protein [uncultured Sutterella sp.]|uniref:RtcB family protein n=1 Tax=uncultured Sutterella sp. TaxID=286133 RepID=UPI00266F532D|nr:RtcB family protein [uncultured Sutterella sp.]
MERIGPHGAGRILKRDAVKNVLTVSRLREEMKAAGIQSPSISAETLDEAPEAYRALADILPALAPTVRVTQRLVPVWCFKGGKG